MAIPLTINGVTFQYPQQFDKNWGPTLTNWSSAVTSGMLQKAGGSFPLTAEVDFGGSFGLKVLSVKSQESNIATTGIVRLANASTGIVWRNALHNADLALTVNASNQLTFNGISIGATTSLTNGHILVGDVSNQPADVAMTGDISITNAGVTAIGAGKIVNAQINSSAAIALSKLAPTTAYYWYVANASGVATPQGVTASRAVATDANGLPVASATTATELGYVNGVTSAIQTQIDGKVSKSGDTMSGVLNMGSHKIISVTGGTNSGEAITYDQANSVTTNALVANAVTNLQSSANGTSGLEATTITTLSITTTGGPVLVIGSAYVQGNPDSNGDFNFNYSISRNSLSVPGGSLKQTNRGQNTAAPTVRYAAPITVVDTPGVGTFTYQFSVSLTAGASLTIPAYSLQAIELKR